MVQVKATTKGVRISPRKVGEVASLVRGRTAKDALVILEHTPRRAALSVAKTIRSAQANAENNHNLSGDKLVIETLRVNPGTMMKRYRPAAHGRALPYKKRSSHIEVVLVGEEKKAKSAAKTADKSAKTEKKAEEK